MMPKGKGYKKKSDKYDIGHTAVNVNYSTPHQKVIQVQKRPKALGMGKVGVIGMTSMGNHKTGKQSTKMGY